jgi:hypothetical protein
MKEIAGLFHVQVTFRRLSFICSVSITISSLSRQLQSISIARFQRLQAYSSSYAWDDAVKGAIPGFRTVALRSDGLDIAGSRSRPQRELLPCLQAGILKKRDIKHQATRSDTNRSTA